MESMSDSDKQDVLTWALTPTLGVRAKAHGMQRTVHSINPRLTGVAKEALVKVLYAMEEFNSILEPTPTEKDKTASSVIHQELIGMLLPAQDKLVQTLHCRTNILSGPQLL